MVDGKTRKLLPVGCLALGGFLWWGLTCVLHSYSDLTLRPTNTTPRTLAIPDEATAVAVGTAILRPVYGGLLWSERPFRATLTNGVWWVRGSLPSGSKGGVAEVYLSQTNSAVLDLFHSK